MKMRFFPAFLFLLFFFTLSGEVFGQDGGVTRNTPQTPAVQRLRPHARSPQMRLARHHPPRPIPPSRVAPTGWVADYFYNPYTGNIKTEWRPGYVLIEANEPQRQRTILDLPVYYFDPASGALSATAIPGWVEVRRNTRTGTVSMEVLEEEIFIEPSYNGAEKNTSYPYFFY
jgi:hypothetical protein